MCLTLIFLKVMHDVACYKAIPHNTTNCLLLNYTWTDADGCLEHQGGCYAEFLTVLDGGIPFYMTYFRRERPENVSSPKKRMVNSKSACPLCPG